MEKKIVASELVEERANCNFDQNELAELIFPPSRGREIAERVAEDIRKDVKLQKSHKHYEYTAKEAQEHWMKKLNYMWYNKDR